MTQRNFGFAVGVLAGLIMGLSGLQFAFADGNPGWDDCWASAHCSSLVEQPVGSGNWVCLSTPRWIPCSGNCSPCKTDTASPLCPAGYQTCKCAGGDDGGWDICVTCLKVNGLGDVIAADSCSAWFCPPTSACEWSWDSGSNSSGCECFAPPGP